MHECRHECRQVCRHACRLYGLDVGEGDTAVGVLKENTVNVSEHEKDAIFAAIKPLQTPAPGKFERKELELLLWLVGISARGSAAMLFLSSLRASLVAIRSFLATL